MRKLYFFLLVLVFISCCLGISSCLYVGGCYQCNLSAEVQREVKLEQEMDVGMTFAVETTHSHIHILGIDEKQCYITANIRVRSETVEKAREIAEKVKVGFKKSGDRVVIVVDKPEMPENYRVYVSYDVKLPKKTNVILKTTHDNIECHNLKGNVTASTTHDPIVCTNIVGNLKLNTTHDSIKLKNIIGQVEANATHGPIEAENVKGPLNLQTTHDRIVCREIESERLRVRTSHDNIYISFNEMAKGAIDADVVTSHGDIMFDLPNDFSGKVSMSTTHGKVKTQVPLLVKGELSEEQISGFIGEGTGMVSLKTSHGSINIE